MKSADVRVTDSPSCPHSQCASLQPHRRYCPTALRGGGGGSPTAAPLFRGCRPDTTCASAPARVGRLLQGTDVTVLPASHLQGDPTAFHRTGPAELETDSRHRNRDRKPAMTSQSEGTLIQPHQPLLPVFQRKAFITPSSLEC